MKHLSALLLLLVLPTLMACPPIAVDDDDSSDVPASHLRLVVGSIAGDFASGSLSEFDTETGTLQEGVVTTNGDARVQALGGDIALLERGSVNAVSVFAKGDWAAPRFQTGLGDGANPNSIVSCGGFLWVSLYGGVGVAQLNESDGSLLSTVNLSSYDPIDAIPEAAALVTVGTTLYVALELWDFANFAPSTGNSVVVAIDCGSATVSDDMIVPFNASIKANPLNPSTLLLSAGQFYVADDGLIAELDLSTGILGAPLVDEADLNGDLEAWDVNGAGDLLVSASGFDGWTHYCLPQGGSLTELETTTSWWSQVLAGSDDSFWVAQRPSWLTDPGTTAIRHIDATSCTNIDSPPAPILPPMTLALHR